MSARQAFRHCSGVPPGSSRLRMSDPLRLTPYSSVACRVAPGSVAPPAGAAWADGGGELALALAAPHVTASIRAQFAPLQTWPEPMTRVGGAWGCRVKSMAAAKPCDWQKASAAGLPHSLAQVRQKSRATPSTSGLSKWRVAGTPPLAGGRAAWAGTPAEAAWTGGGALAPPQVIATIRAQIGLSQTWPEAMTRVGGAWNCGVKSMDAAKPCDWQKASAAGLPQSRSKRRQ